MGHAEEAVSGGWGGSRRRDGLPSWWPVTGFEGLYEVSDGGQVRSLDRVVAHCHGSTKSIKGRVLRPSVRADGRSCVSLKRDGQRVIRAVHRLVLEAFVGPCPEGMEGCHEDGDPTNNRLENLRWGTHSSNMLDRVRHGNHPNTQKTHCPQEHPLVEGNLRRSKKLQGHRACLICHRAKGGKDVGRLD